MFPAGPPTIKGQGLSGLAGILEPTDGSNFRAVAQRANVIAPLRLCIDTHYCVLPHWPLTDRAARTLQAIDLFGVAHGLAQALPNSLNDLTPKRGTVRSEGNGPFHALWPCRRTVQESPFGRHKCEPKRALGYRESVTGPFCRQPPEDLGTHLGTS
jgi:hypothetical protein